MLGWAGFTLYFETSLKACDIEISFEGTIFDLVKV